VAHRPCLLGNVSHAFAHTRFWLIESILVLGVIAIVGQRYLPYVDVSHIQHEFDGEFDYDCTDPQMFTIVWIIAA
jgi:hypothetical protein